jgi:hypothetical protein
MHKPLRHLAAMHRSARPTLRTTLTALVALLGPIACRSNELVAGVTDSTFVATMAELERVRSNLALDSARRDALRASILTRHRVSGAQMEAAGRALGLDPNRAADVWQAIEAKAADTLKKPVAPKPRKAAPK